MDEESWEDKKARFRKEIPGVSLHAIVLGSLRSRGERDTNTPAISAADVLTAIHVEKDIRNLVWIGVDQTAVRYEWFRPLVEMMVEAWAGWAAEQGLDPDDLTERKLFYANHAIGEINLFGAWRMWRSGKPEIASKFLVNARDLDNEWRAPRILGHMLEHPDKYPHDKMPTLHAHGPDTNVCTGGDLDELFPYDGLAPSSDWL